MTPDCASSPSRPSDELVLDASWVAREARRLSNWGRWGPDDQLGTWNLVTPAKVQEAAACVRRGSVFSLSLPFGPSGPSARAAAGRTNALHFFQPSGTDAAAGAGPRLPGDVSFADDWVVMNLSTSTQWDGLSHVFHAGLGYNGVPASSVSSWGARRNSITELRDRIVTRGVLIDLPRCLGQSWCEPGVPIQPEDLDAALDRQGVRLGAGDVVLIRTGHLAQIRSAGSGWGDYAGTGPAPGLGVRCGAWLAGRDVAAVACDTWGLEVLPYETPDTIAPLHQIILTHCGITIGEMFDLEALASDCAADGVYDFMLVAPILPVDGAVNSPVNPQAIK